MPRRNCDIYYLRWLKPSDARAMARLERRTYPRKQRSGKAYIAATIAHNIAAGGNLALGMFLGKRLCGFMHGYRVDDRRQCFDEFEVKISANVEQPEGSSVYIDDLIFLPEHAGQLANLLRTWLQQVHVRAPGLPLDAFCLPDTLRRWTKYQVAFRRLGFEIQTPVPVSDDTYDEQWSWLSWKSLGAPKLKSTNVRTDQNELTGLGLSQSRYAYVVRTLGQWQALTADWRALLARRKDTSLYSTPELLMHWWRVYGFGHHLRIVALYDGEQLIGIAPMMLAALRQYGRVYSCLQFIGDNTSIDKPHLLTCPDSRNATADLLTALLSRKHEWEMAYLHEQIDSHLLARALPSHQLMGRCSAPLESSQVDCEQGWETYLMTRSRSQRKNIQRKTKPFSMDSAVEIYSGTNASITTTWLERYLNVERRSWKFGTESALGSDRERQLYLRRLFECLPDDTSVQAAFLRYENKDIGASLSLVYQRRLAALEVCHDQAYDRLSPGFVITSRELQHCMCSADVATFDFLTGVPENKRSWSTKTKTVHDVYWLPTHWHGQLVAFIAFRLKPGLKHALERIGAKDAALAVLDRFKRAGVRG